MNKNRFRRIMRSMAGRKVIVVGDIILDRYVWGRVTRISPEAPIPVLEVLKETYRLGAGANVADNLKAMGVTPICISVVGADEDGNELRRQFGVRGLSTAAFVVDRERPTTVKTRVIAHHQQVVRIDRENTAEIPLKVEKEALARFKRIVSKADAVIISDYAKGMITPGLFAAITEQCLEKDLFTALDPKEKHFGYYRGVSIMTPNHKEAEHGSGVRISSPESLRKAGEELIRKCGLKACLITLGEQGMALFTEGKAPLTIPTRASEVYDVTGAGDTVISVLTAAVAGGASMPEAAEIANHAAGRVVREIGTATVTPEELEKAMFGKG